MRETTLKKLGASHFKAGVVDEHFEVRIVSVWRKHERIVDDSLSQTGDQVCTFGHDKGGSPGHVEPYDEERLGRSL